jgi:DNA-binding NarL/FixJ family response regulator
LDKTYSCPYCNGEGRTYIEAADKTIATWINNLSTERKSDIMKYVSQGLTNAKK